MWHPHTIMAKICTRYRNGFLGRRELLCQVSESDYWGFYTGFSLANHWIISTEYWNAVWMSCVYGLLVVMWVQVTCPWLQSKNSFKDILYPSATGYQLIKQHSCTMPQTSGMPPLVHPDRESAINRRRSTNSLRLLTIFSGIWCFISGWYFYTSQTKVQ